MPPRRPSTRKPLLEPTGASARADPPKPAPVPYGRLTEHRRRAAFQRRKSMLGADLRSRQRQDERAGARKWAGADRGHLRPDGQRPKTSEPPGRFQVRRAGPGGGQVVRGRKAANGRPRSSRVVASRRAGTRGWRRTAVKFAGRGRSAIGRTRPSVCLPRVSSTSSESPAAADTRQLLVAAVRVLSKRTGRGPPQAPAHALSMRPERITRPPVSARCPARGPVANR